MYTLFIRPYNVEIRIIIVILTEERTEKKKNNNFSFEGWTGVSRRDRP